MYQTFDNRPGSSNSPQKWNALNIKRLDGLSVLDIGCNEGFFTAKAAEVGARNVTGIDSNDAMIKSAIKRYPELNFATANWDDYLQSANSNSFDVIFMLSAFHYVADRQRFIQEIYRLLKDDGIFVLEVGLVDDKFGIAIPVDRGVPPNHDRVWHLTSESFKEQFGGLFSLRLIGPSVAQPGDPIQRYVFHCVKRRPWILMIGGNSGKGKSDLSNLLSDRRSVFTISLDHLVQALVKRDEADANQMQFDLRGLITKAIANPAVIEDIIASIFVAIPPTADVCIVEGILLDDEYFRSRLREYGEIRKYRLATIELDSPSYYKKYSGIVM